MPEKPTASAGDRKGTPSARNDHVCAVIIAYFPDKKFKERLLAVLPQVDLLVVVDNTPKDASSWQAEIPLEKRALIRYVQNHANLGIATALNQGLQLALEAECQWLLTLDQDTQCYSDMIQTLLQAATSCKPQPAVIGGNYFDAKRKSHDAPPDHPERCIERKTVITSGCLVDATFAQAAGGFPDDYFIDQVDHEVCLRMRAHNGRVVITRKPVMDHSVGGQSGPKVPLLGMMLPDHSPLRKYYITRNSLVMVATYWRYEPSWCLVRLARLFGGIAIIALFEPDKLLKLKAFAVGLLDAVRGRMGVCSHAWLKED